MSTTALLDDKKETIFASLDAGISQRQIHRELNEDGVSIARSTLQDWIKNNGGTPAASLSEDPSSDFEECPVFYRDYSHLDKLYVYPLGDVHIGSPAHAADRWQEWLHYVEEQENASLLGTGDYLNSALKQSKSESYDETMRVGVAKRVLRRQLKPLADANRLDLLEPGNHEARIYRAVGDCPIEDVADSLGVNYAKDVAVVVYRVGEVTYSVYVRHGTGGGQIGARATRLSKQAQTLLADVYVSGHTHSELVFPQDVFEIDMDALVLRRKRQYFVSSGSFVNYEGYAAAMGLPPQKIGAARIRLDGSRRDIHVSI